MHIASFDDLLQAARLQSQPQQLLFVFAGAELPVDASAATVKFEVVHFGDTQPRDTLS